MSQEHDGAPDVPNLNGEEADLATSCRAHDLAEGRGIPTCCVRTMNQHVRFNPMMVCAECKNIIKCFIDERAFENYVKFCQSRRRPIETGKVQDYWTVVFRSYDTYSR